MARLHPTTLKMSGFYAFTIKNDKEGGMKLIAKKAANIIESVKMRTRLKRLRRQQKDVAIRYVQNQNLIKRAEEASQEQKCLRQQFTDLKVQIKDLDSIPDDDEPDSISLTQEMYQLCLAS